MSRIAVNKIANRLKTKEVNVEDLISGVDFLQGLQDQTEIGKGISLLNFQQAGNGAVVRNLLSKLRELSVTPFDFGAIGDGTLHTVQEWIAPGSIGWAKSLSEVQVKYPHVTSANDSIDWTATVSALNSGASVVSAPICAGYYMSKGITIPRKVELQGEAIFCENYQGAGPQGTKFIFASDVPVCMHVSGLTANKADASGTPGLRRVVVTRNGVIPAGSIGVKVSGAANSTLEDVFSDRHAKGFQWLGKGGSTDVSLNGGLACNCTRLFTGAISDTHFEIDSWPELRVTGGRSGMNGTGNLPGTSFVRITSPNGGTGGAGPNTISFMNYQFNQGQVGPAYHVEFVNNTAGAGNQVIYEFTNCHVENISTAYIKSYANSGYIQKLQYVSGTLNTKVPLFDIHPNTMVSDVSFTGVDIAASTLSMGANYVNGLRFSGSSFSNTVATLTAPTSNNWVVSFVGNTWQVTSSLTIAGSGWANCLVDDVFGFDSTVRDNSGSKNVVILSSKRNILEWTPSLNIGGNANGITYSTTAGVYQIVGRVVTLNFRIFVTNKGSNTGVVTIANLPFPAAGNALDGHSGSCGYVQNMVGLTGPVSVRVSNSNSLELRQSNSTGNTVLTEANIANNTVITGSISYFI